MAIKNYLQLLISCLFLLALLGLFGVLGPTQSSSILGSFYWANIPHAQWQAIIGVILLYFLLRGTERGQRGAILGYVIYGTIGIIGDAYRLSVALPENKLSGPPTIGNIIFLILMITLGIISLQKARKEVI